MTKKIETPNDSPVVAARSWFFPTLGKTVTAATYKEALKLAKSQKKEEEGDAI